MAILESIQQARKRGATDEQIIQEIQKQNPNKSGSFESAQRRGAGASTVLNEIIKQNSQQQQEPQKDFLDKLGGIGRGITSFTGGRKIGEFLGGTIASTPGLGPLVTGVDTTPEERRTIQQNLPSTGEVLKSAAGAAATGLLSIGGLKGVGIVGKSFLQRVLVSAGLGAGFAETGAIEERGKLATPKELALGAGVGAALPGAGVVARKTFGIIKGTPQFVSNFFFGPKGTSGIKVRFKDPQGVARFLSTARRQAGGQNVEDITTLLNKSITAVRNTANRVYEEGLKRIEDSRVVSLQRVTIQGQRAARIFNPDTGETIDLTIQGIKGKLTKELRKFNVFVDTRKQALNFTESPLDKIEERKLREVFQTINSWKDLAPLGLNRLARKIGNFRRPGQTSNEFNLIIDNVRRNIRGYVGDRIPEVRTLNQTFTESADLLDKLSVNIEGTARLNVDQTSQRLFRLAKSLDDPFTFEGSEKILLELEKRTGVPFFDILRALATAENLSPQKAQGLRSGVIRELVRLLEVGISEVAGVSGQVAQKIPRVPSIPTGGDATSNAFRTIFLEELSRLFREENSQR